jgi:type II secretory pathway pseudopilin PulG
MIQPSASSLSEDSDGWMPFKIRQHSFALVELVVVIAIISMLMVMILLAVQSARKSGRRAQ